MTQPILSIAMPIFNAERYLVRAVSSIIEQTFADWELVAVNDGSTDQTPEILNWFAQHDERIRVIHQENRGLVGALQRTVDEARAPLIARMDADDIAMPDRLDKQLAFLRSHPSHVAVGGAILQMDADSDPLGIERLPADHEQIEANLLTRRTGMFHPTVMMRTSVMRACGGYRMEYEFIEDHDLWLRLAHRGKLANLADVVLCYRQHSTSVCWSKSNIQRERMNHLLREAYSVRNRHMPEGLVMESSVRRSRAGHGKWARMAAKSGSPKIAWKHLAEMWREPTELKYRLRMTGEILARLAMRAPKVPFLKLFEVPADSPWQDRYAFECSGNPDGSAKAA